jgi:sulfur carrier protein ThiS
MKHLGPTGMEQLDQSNSPDARRSLMKRTKNQILMYAASRCGGWADCLDLPEGLSVEKLFRERMAGQQPEDFLVRVNHQPVGPDTLLQDGDRVTITPLKT